MNVQQVNHLSEPDKSVKSRKPVYLNEKQLIKMGQLGLSNRVIAFISGCDEKTIRNKYADVIEKGRSQLVRKINTKLIELALKGNITAIIWAGKQFCGHSDTLQIPPNQSLTVLKQTINTNTKGEVEIRNETKEIEAT